MESQARKGPHIRRQGFPGSPNTDIPPPKLDTDECPAVCYVTALMHHLRFLWQNRSTFPSEVILQTVTTLTLSSGASSVTQT
jgi:hypothetical protein